MEIFRQLGIEQSLYEIVIPHSRTAIRATSMPGEEFIRISIEKVIPESVREWSPTWGIMSSQEIIAPVLLAQARRRELVQIRFSKQLASFEQYDEYVLATLVHRPSRRVQRVRAKYLIGADGAHSTVREA